MKKRKREKINTKQRKITRNNEKGKEIKEKTKK